MLFVNSSKRADINFVEIRIHDINTLEKVTALWYNYCGTYYDNNKFITGEKLV